MGNNPTKEARTGSPSHSQVTGTTPTASSSNRPTPSTRASELAAAEAANNARRRGSSRHDLGLFRLGAHHDPDPADPMARRETRAEREARKREKERELRAVERERSMKEEGVDGGYLVTLGTYTGTEDFNKQVVRQLMIERRLAPFWKGLQDHEDSWTDNQLIAVARGEPLPAPGPTPTIEEMGGSSPTSHSHSNSLAVPSTGFPERPRSPSNPEHNSPSLFGSPPSSSPFFRSRARTLVQLSTSRSNSNSDMTPQENSLPKDPYVNGQPLEAFLYKHASECPICFLYYPPYLNKTRCCDQSICSECFVQIKRPDPHPPEHHDDPDNPHPQPPPENNLENEYMLVSEPATCPFCKQPEFGITYEPPPFRRGLVYNEGHRLGSVMSAMSSSSSINSQSPSSGTRRRTTSLGADSPNVITTDKVRPDWAKKLSDARAHALRRAAAATALHNAAYVLGNQGDNGPRLAFGRRRRTLFGSDSPGGSGGSVDGLGFAHVGALLAASDRGQPGDGGSSDLYPARGASRRSRIDDLEDLMMAEAIRLSLAAEEEERKKRDKENAKIAKKEEKQKAKEAKKAEKAVKKGTGGIYSTDLNSSSTSQFIEGSSSSGFGIGKGKAPAEAPYGFNPLNEPTSTINAESSKAPKEDPQRFLEASRAKAPIPVPTAHRQALRHLSTASSSSSLAQDAEDPSPNGSGMGLDVAGGNGGANHSRGGSLYSETPPTTEPMFNFRSLAAVIGNEEGKEGGNVVEYVEHAGPHSPLAREFPMEEGESSSPIKSGMVTPPQRPMSTGEKLFGSAPVSPVRAVADNKEEDGAVLAPTESNPYDAKHYGDISVLDTGHFGSAR